MKKVLTFIAIFALAISTAYFKSPQLVYATGDEGNDEGNVCEMVNNEDVATTIDLARNYGQIGRMTEDSNVSGQSYYCTTDHWKIGDYYGVRSYDIMSDEPITITGTLKSSLDIGDNANQVSFASIVKCLVQVCNLKLENVEGQSNVGAGDDILGLEIWAAVDDAKINIELVGENKVTNIRPKSGFNDLDSVHFSGSGTLRFNDLQNHIAHGEDHISDGISSKNIEIDENVSVIIDSGCSDYIKFDAEKVVNNGHLINNSGNVNINVSDSYTGRPPEGSQKDQFEPPADYTPVYDVCPEGQIGTYPDCEPKIEGDITGGADTGNNGTGNKDTGNKVTGKQEKSPVKVTSVSVKELATNGIIQGKTLKLETKILPANATNKSVKYSSSNNKIASVDSNGKVKGLKQGKVTITVIAKDGSNKKAKVTLYIVDKKVAKKTPLPISLVVKKITVGKKKLTITFNKLTSKKIVKELTIQYRLKGSVKFTTKKVTKFQKVGKVTITKLKSKMAYEVAFITKKVIKVAKKNVTIYNTGKVKVSGKVK